MNALHMSYGGCFDEVVVAAVVVCHVGCVAVAFNPNKIQYFPFWLLFLLLLLSMVMAGYVSYG